MRTKFIDEIVLKRAAAGLDELILLGAGLDSRPYRMTEQLSGVRVIEVDHPVTQTFKRARVRRLLGGEPEHVTFLPVDFTRDDLSGSLDAVGHKRTVRTLFVCSGVSMYLPETAIAQVLSFVAAHEQDGVSIVFDACWEQAIDGTSLIVALLSFARASPAEASRCVGVCQRAGSMTRSHSSDCEPCEHSPARRDTPSTCAGLTAPCTTHPPGSGYSCTPSPWKGATNQRPTQAFAARKGGI